MRAGTRGQVDDGGARFVLRLRVAWGIFGAARRVRVYEVFVEGAKEGFQVAVTGSRADRELVADIASQCRTPLLNLAGRTSLALGPGRHKVLAASPGYQPMSAEIDPEANQFMSFSSICTRWRNRAKCTRTTSRRCIATTPC